ncbi:hypothetical protein OAS15_02060 [Candidatus Pelagibacter sp.]|nr:hypothetical protein [Candidatus Pelagibacter sp.]
MSSITYSSQYKIISVTNLILFLLIVPKIAFFDINNYHQGIRIENFISIILFLIILFHPKNFKINYPDKFYLFCVIIFLSYSIGVLNDIPLQFLVIIRIFEYIVFVIFFSNFKLNYKKIITFFKYLIIINAIISFLQYQEIIGFFSSRGYFEPDYNHWKSAGVFSGSWELSFVSSILYFIIYHHDKKKFNIYFYLTLIILYFAKTRGVMVPFVVSILFLYLNNFRISIFNLFLLPLILYLIYFLTLKYLGLDIFILLNSLIKLIFFNENLFISFSNLDREYYSWAYRLRDWSAYTNYFNKNFLTFLFGPGYTAIYYESFVLRILLANGIFGFAILSILILRTKLYMIIFLLITGLSLDFVVSFKMFIILFIYFSYLRYSEKLT